MAGDRQIVQLDAPADEAELAADALWQAAPSAVSEVPLADGRVRLTADVADLAALDGRWSVVILEVDGEAHLDAWRAWAVPVRCGRRILLQPAWLPIGPVGPADVVVSIDPGRSFGSGSHPSTRLVLAALEDLVEGGERVLDVGCGSGVLAVAACLLGAGSAVAVDIDPVAVEVTSENAARNGVGERVAASAATLTELDGVFDVVVANIGRRVLLDLAPGLVRAVRPGGALVLAGLLEDQADEVVALCAGAAELGRPVEEGWAAPVLRRVS